jgi:hypothetical protein
MVTTISVSPEVRDRLKAFCGGGVSYSEALTSILDRIEMDEFFEQARRAADDPSHPWETIAWDDPAWD